MPKRHLAGLFAVTIVLYLICSREIGSQRVPGGSYYGRFGAKDPHHAAQSCTIPKLYRAWARDVFIQGDPLFALLVIINSMVDRGKELASPDTVRLVVYSQPSVQFRAFKVWGNLEIPSVVPFSLIRVDDPICDTVAAKGIFGVHESWHMDPY